MRQCAMALGPCEETLCRDLRTAVPSAWPSATTLGQGGSRARRTLAASPLLTTPRTSSMRPRPSPRPAEPSAGTPTASARSQTTLRALVSWRVRLKPLSPKCSAQERPGTFVVTQAHDGSQQSLIQRTEQQGPIRSSLSSERQVGNFCLASWRFSGWHPLVTEGRRLVQKHKEIGREPVKLSSMTSLHVLWYGRSEYQVVVVAPASEVKSPNSCVLVIVGVGNVSTSGPVAC